MTFASFAFVAFFVIVLLALAACRSRVQRQLVILLASVYFYAYWNPRYLFLLATPSVIDYWCAQRIARAEDDRRRKLWLIASLVSNLGLLAYFKYATFLLQNLAWIGGRTVAPLDIVLPVGISFYTFKTMSYTIDVYRRQIEPCRSWWQYALYVTYFPELVAGPIVRASMFLPQMTRALTFSGPRTYAGLQQVALGFSKKLLVADRLATFVTPVFAMPAIYSAATVRSAVIAYALQIYCDFSGYSDIAIGVSTIIGFDLPENFNMPYAATSISEFWRRWHMTLSQWLRDYLYIPLGGSRCGRVRTYLNLTITMLLGGLWHGASWTFVAWGGLHGLSLVVHKIWRDAAPRRGWELPSWLAWAMTVTYVCFAWVLFRAPTFQVAGIVAGKVLGLDPVGVRYVNLPLTLILPVVVIAHFVGRAANRSVQSAGSRPAWAARFYPEPARFAIRPHPQAGAYARWPATGFALGLLTTTWALVFYLFAAVDSSPFIYFQF